MIGWLNGQIMDTQQPGKLVLDVNGVGYDVETSLNTFFQLNAQTHPIGLHIHTLVREDALLLYGFLDKLERSLFRALIKVNGVGPKLAMSILSRISPVEFIQCIVEADTDLLTQLPGIGKKTAERLLVEMKGSVKQFSEAQKPSTDNKPSLQSTNEAVSALETLGYKQAEASKVVHKIDDGHKSAEQLIREALQVLSKK